MNKTPAFLIDQLHSDAVAGHLQAAQAALDTPTIREATVAPGVLVAITIHPSGVTTWRLNGERSHRAAVYLAALQVGPESLGTLPAASPSLSMNSLNPHELCQHLIDGLAQTFPGLDIEDAADETPPWFGFVSNTATVVVNVFPAVISVRSEVGVELRRFSLAHFDAEACLSELSSLDALHNERRNIQASSEIADALLERAARR